MIGQRNSACVESLKKRYKCYHRDVVLTKTASKEEYNPGARKEARDRPGVTTSYSESVTDD